MDKTPQKITKDPKGQERGKKSHETHMKRLKGNILRNNQLSTPSSTDNSTPSTPSSTDNSTLLLLLLRITLPQDPVILLSMALVSLLL